jgi:hypothetical protein
MTRHHCASGEVPPRFYVCESSRTYQHLEEGMGTMTMMLSRLILEFLMVQRSVGKGYTQRPSSRNGVAHMQYRVGAGRTDRDLFQPSKYNFYKQFVVLHQTCRPPTYANTVMQSLATS